MNLALFVGLFGTQSPRKGSLVLADFMHKVRNTENHKSHIVLFLKNGGDRSGGLKKLLSAQVCFFSLNIKVLMVIKLSAKNACEGKILFFIY